MDDDSRPYDVAMHLQSVMGVVESPVLLAIDDAHLLDLQSQEVLGFVARRVRPFPIALLFAGDSSVHPIPVLDGLGVLRLGELGAGDVVDLLQATYEDMAGSVAETLGLRVGGNPYVLLDVAKQLRPAQRRGQSSLDRYLPASPVLKDLLLPDFDGLSRGQRFALLVAVISEDRKIGPMLTALAAESEDVVEWLLQGHVDVSGGTYKLRTPAVDSVVWRAAALADRIRAHRLLAQAYEGHDPDGALWHHAQAQLEPDDGLAGQLQRAAVEILDRGEPDRSVAYAREAVRLTSTTDERFQRLLLAGELAVFAGRCSEAVQIALERLRVDASVEQNAELALLEARARLVADGQPPTDLVDGQAAQFAEADPDRAAKFWLVAATGFADRIELAPARAYLARVESVLPHLSEATLGKFRRIAAWVAALAGDRERAVELIEADSRASDVLADADRCTRHAMVLTRLERFDEARQLLRVITDQRRFGDSPLLAGYAYSVTAVLEIRAGRLTAAAEAAAGWQRMLGETWPHRGKVMLYMIRAHALTGDSTAALECRDWGRRLAHRLGDWWSSALLQSEAGALYLHLNRLDEAMSALERAHGYALEYDDPSILAVEPDFIEVCVRRGELERARSVLAVFETRVARVPGSWAKHTLARCRALVAEDEESLKLFEVAMETCADKVSPVELTRTQLCYGERLRQLGRRIEAAEWLRRAIVRANECGASALAASAEAVLGSGGTAVGDDATRGREIAQLTEAELRVASLVAGGERNREIAEKLHVSVRTIEAHLGRIYRKLAVRSRAQLASVVAAADAPSGEVPAD